MKRICFYLIILITAPAVAHVADLYEVLLHSELEAEWLKSSGATPVLRIGNVYLVIADDSSFKAYPHSRLDRRLIEKGVEKGRLALDRRTDRENLKTHRLIYEKGNIRLLSIDTAYLEQLDKDPTLLPLLNRQPEIKYVEPVSERVLLPKLEIELDSLVGLVEQDSVESYLNRLQAFYRRVAGSDSGYAAREWIMSKFQSFGYDSVVADGFIANVFGENRQCYNVVAAKVGALYPNLQIIVGAHYDGVPDSPAANDNGTGTAGVLEIARILQHVATDMTVLFITFDAEESGLHGSWHYADSAADEGRQIIFMFNMDMIGHLTNDTQAKLFHGADMQFARIWIDLAGPLVGINGVLKGASGGSDQFPFDQNGFETVFLHEYDFSDYWHTVQDSTTYVNLDYTTRMIKASLATIYSVANSNDFDHDGVANGEDNCMLIANSMQEDTDSDGLGDVCDNCPSTANIGQEDFDHDMIGDACDACPLDSLNDYDSDGACWETDNCPFLSNSDQDDINGNGVGDACECNIANHTFTGEKNWRFGWAVSSAGDVDNDAFDDVLVGAYGALDGRGHAFVYSGKDGNLLRTFTGDGPGDRLGADVSCAGDVNQDGYDDIIVGAFTANGGNGEAYVFSGQNGAALHTFTGATSLGTLGSAVAGIGDINGDSVPDMLVGAMHYNDLGAGEAFVYSGSDGNQLYYCTAGIMGDWFGVRVSCAGDVNNDGIPDFIVGAPRDSETAARVGRAYVYSGQNGSVLHIFTGEAAGDALGAAVSGIGDINDDGCDDLLIGASQTGSGGSGQGLARIFSGSDGSILRTHEGENDGDGFGQQVSGLGDIDGDGYEDYAIAAPGGTEFKQAANIGRVFLYSGKEGLLLYTYTGETLGDLYGWDVSAAGDVNGDGAADLIVGAYLNGEEGNDAGRAHVYLLGDSD
ncbi:MAG: M28 family peptidase, partial [Candidatus Zixiibacteriota bacterium]